ncbi:predicted protein [Nematostella vectensis]|uniref:PNPLA domain-containing protein n=1 Tax=Nematostella vectensis TaxID=45351 RepID=A7S645_NEMVE|nr:predicted protein [Nematostella vectensis]|eukprot:XP_001632856.1 predicted protein [Nematostella vectensis]
MSKDERRTGLAFSGGGIRSAAFCSGVLRRMLQKSVPVDYLSCVSGGGFTGSAYLDWKYRNELKDDARWHAEFFENMRKNSNSYCNCRNPCQALFDGFILFFLIFVVTFISPWLTGFSFVIPTAYIVNYFFGDILRAPFTCPSTRKRNFTSSQIQENPGTLTLVNITNTIECVPKFGPHMYSTLVLFVSLFAAFLTLFFLKEILKKRLKNFTRFLFNLVGFTLAMTFLPWFIEEYIVVTPLWANALIIVLSVFLWLGLPPLRDKASVAMIVYFYAYAVKWMVYKTDVLYVRFTHDRFAALMYASGILIWLNPFIGLLQQNAVHIYNRWRLQKSFYSPESVGASGCAGITCQDVIPWCACSGNDTAERLNRPVTFGDIEDVKPQLICNVTAHHWKRTEGDEHSYELLTIAPDVIERIDRCVEEAEFDSTHISPHDVKLSVAMAASAAVVSYDLGKAQSINAGFRDLQILLGLGLGKRMISHKRGNTCLARVSVYTLDAPPLCPPSHPLQLDPCAAIIKIRQSERYNFDEVIA